MMQEPNEHDQRCPGVRSAHRGLTAAQEKEDTVAMDANWRDDAACLYADPELFFPASMTGPALDQVDEAIRICRTCPVCEECLTWALDVGNVSGIWGGSTEDERRALLRTASRRRHGALPKARVQASSADA